MQQVIGTARTLERDAVFAQMLALTAGVGLVVLGLLVWRAVDRKLEGV